MVVPLPSEFDAVTEYDQPGGTKKPTFAPSPAPVPIIVLETSTCDIDPEVAPAFAVTAIIPEPLPVLAEPTVTETNIVFVPVLTYTVDNRGELLAWGVCPGPNIPGTNDISVDMAFIIPLFISVTKLVRLPSSGTLIPCDTSQLATPAAINEDWRRTVFIWIDNAVPATKPSASMDVRAAYADGVRQLAAPGVAVQNGKMSVVAMLMS